MLCEVYFAKIMVIYFMLESRLRTDSRKAH